jgi:hypothetical protein
MHRPTTQHVLRHSCAAAVACRQYDQRGIQMDRLLLWEAKPANPPSTIFAELPKDLFHKYQYFNIPAITHYKDASHPVSGPSDGGGKQSQCAARLHAMLELQFV